MLHRVFLVRPMNKGLSYIVITYINYVDRQMNRNTFHYTITLADCFAQLPILTGYEPGYAKRLKIPDLSTILATTAFDVISQN